MRLDLTRRGALTPEQARLLDEVAEQARAPFHALVAGLAAPHGASLDWWVTPLASRNTFSSGLYLRCCQAVLAVRLAGASPAPSEILVDSPALAATLRGAAQTRAVPIRCTVPRWRAGAGRLGRRARALAAALYSFGGRALAARLLPPRDAPPASPLTLVDTFLFPDSFDAAGGLREHYYPGMAEALSEAERAALWYVPTPYRVRNPFALFARLRRSPLNFLLPEDYLRPSDYLHALAHPWRVPRVAPGPRMLLGVDVEPLVREAEAEGLVASGTLEALLRRRFALRLRERGIRIRLALEWYENQELDRGAVAGLRAEFPGVPVIGYQGYVVSRHYLCMFPTREEREAGLLPHSVAVVGPAFVQAPKEFCPGIATEAAPAFRFRGLWRDPGAARPPEKFTVLVALPIHVAEARDILERLAQALEGAPRWRVLLKPHPLAPLGRIGPLPAGCELAAGDLDALIAASSVLVGSASSACVQALASGTPVVVMGSLRGLTQNPIPPDTDPRLWALAYTAGELRTALERFASRGVEEAARDRAAGRALRERFFSPVTREAVARLLRFA
jgi:hypothetical protein